MRVSKIDVDTLVNMSRNEAHYDVGQRQSLALQYLKERGRITNWEYVNLCKVGYRTAHRDLSNLIKEGVVEVFKMGRSTYYALQMPYRLKVSIKN
ncbi:DeoR family transcriptional regulator [candidate division KSB1 bacterium]|nr:DeoR family transcriptional regulator [candidate division KSB1 bacterium]